MRRPTMDEQIGELVTGGSVDVSADKTLRKGDFRVRNVSLHSILYNTFYFRGRKISRKVKLKYFRESEYTVHAKISSRENIFPRKYLLAKISSRENIFPRKYPPAKIFPRDFFPCRKYVG